MASADISKIGEAENFGLQLLADGVQQFGKCRIKRPFSRSSAEVMHVADGHKILFYNLDETIRHEAPKSVAATDGAFSKYHGLVYSRWGTGS